MKKLILILIVSMLTISVNSQDLQTTEQIYPNKWEKVKLKGLNLIRLEVPGGWLVREGLGKMGSFLVTDQTRMMIFMPDKFHSWDTSKKEKWEILHLKGLNLHRLKVPEGWLIREGWGKIGGESQNHMIHFVNDPEHTWVIKKR